MNNTTPFQLLLFHRDIAYSKTCVAEGVDGLIIDLETKGKAERQTGFDTEINAHTLVDLEEVKTLADAHILCRINGPGPDTRQEIRDVLNAGADEIIVPMIRHLDEAHAVVEAISGAAGITLMVETVEALGFIPELCALPIDRIYVGMNDLQISRGSETLFDPLIDGSIDRIRTDVRGVQFGFGGLTLRGHGDPVPVHYLVSELARMQANFTFLRRSFYRDVIGHSPKVVFDQMRKDVQQAHTLDALQVSAELDRLTTIVRAMKAA